MSKIGKKPIVIPEGITASINDGAVVLTGKKGTLTVPRLSFVSAALDNNTITLTIKEATKQARANWGTMGALVRGAAEGLEKGYEKRLDVQGIGYKAALEGKSLVLSVGFSHPVKFPVPSGVMVTVEKNFITIAGIDKQLVGQVAAMIRKIKKPEPYQGKGIRYEGEVVRRKEGKKVASSTG